MYMDTHTYAFTYQYTKVSSAQFRHTCTYTNLKEVGPRHPPYAYLHTYPPKNTPTRPPSRTKRRCVAVKRKDEHNKRRDV